MKKAIYACLGATVMLLSLSTSQAASPVGATEMAAGAPAALCGPGYTPTKISYREGVPHSYECTKSIPDQRLCNQRMDRKDWPTKTVGNTLKLSYTCAFPVG